MVEHGILCALALFKQDNLKRLDLEEFRCNSLVEWIDKEDSESAANISEPNTPHSTTEAALSALATMDTPGKNLQFDSETELQTPGVIWKIRRLARKK